MSYAITELRRQSSDCPAPTAKGLPRSRHLRPSTDTVAVTRVLAVTALGAVAVFANGCQRPLSQAEIKFLETRDLDLPYDDAYNAALNGMFSMGLQITHSDRSSGVISGQVGDYAQRAQVHWLVRGQYKVKKVTLLVTPINQQHSRLRMKVLINDQPQFDRQLMTEIWQRIEREAMLETRPVSATTGSTGHPDTRSPP